MANFELPPGPNNTSPVESITKSEAASIPSTALMSLSNGMAALLAALSMQAAQIMNRVQKLSGESSIAVPGKGRNSVESMASVGKVNTSMEAMVGPAVSVAALVTSSAANGDPVLNNPTAAGSSDDDAASAAVKVGLLLGTAALLGGSGGSGGSRGLSATDSAEMSILESSASQLQVTAQIAEDNLATIQSVLQDRADGILDEPDLNLTPFESTDPAIVKIADDYAAFVTNNVVTPFKENQDRFAKLSQQTQFLLKDEDKPLFDLTYGPPISVKGQFILSDDGLYYDVVNGGIPIVSGITAASSNWNLSYAPNLGGKGEVYTQKNLDNLADTLFSIDYAPEDSIAHLYYNTDDVLETFNKDKIYHTTLIHDQISDLTTSGYAEDSAIVVNYYSNIGAIASMYDEKIDKRKKQLQLVSIFATDKYSFTENQGEANPKNLGLGAGLLIEERSAVSNIPNDWHLIERIPLNDFSFLKGQGLNVSLKNQEKLLLMNQQ